MPGTLLKVIEGAPEHEPDIPVVLTARYFGRYVNPAERRQIEAEMSAEDHLKFRWVSFNDEEWLLHRKWAVDLGCPIEP